MTVPSPLRLPCRPPPHSAWAGFEGGLVIILLSVMSLWLDISPPTALLANLGLLDFFFFYAIAFTLCFDRVFGLPASARAVDDDRV